jgi:glycosyltransferase involved in cell wall biosynthesis
MKALVVSYAFPPTGGAGVARMLKLLKYLPNYGISPSVLTVANPSVPVTDRSRVRDVAADLDIVRARTFEPSYAMKAAASTSDAAQATLGGKMRGYAARAARAVLVPDAQVLWQPAAQLALARRLVTAAPDVVLATAPPFSAFLLGATARLRPGVGVVIDYRDEWITWRESYENASRLAAITGAPLEKALLRAAHVVTVASPAFRDNLLERFPFLRSERVIVIPNGFDPDDYPADLPEPPSDKFVITYAGTIYRLTSPRGTLAAIRKLNARVPELARYLEANFIGRMVPSERPLFEGTAALGVRTIDYMEHAALVPQLAASHINLVIQPDVPGTERIYPGKIFELMAIGRPVMAITPPGALADLVRVQRLGEVFHPDDEDAIAAALERHLRDFVAGRTLGRVEPVDCARYQRKVLAGDFVRAFAMARDLARA